MAKPLSACLQAKKEVNRDQLRTLPTYFDGYYSTLQRSSLFDKKKRMATTTATGDERGGHGENMISQIRRTAISVRRAPAKSRGRTSDRTRDSSSLSTPTITSTALQPHYHTDVRLLRVATSEREQGASMHRLPRSRGMDVRIVDVGRPRVGVAPSPYWPRTTPLSRGAHFRRNIWWICGAGRSENAPGDIQDPEATDDTRD